MSTLDGIIGLSPSSTTFSPSLTPLNIALIVTAVFLACICVALTVIIYLSRASKLTASSDMSGIVSESINNYALMSS